MSSKRKFFSIHNILNFVVIDRAGYFNQIFNNFDVHYANFVTDGKIEDCDLIIEIGKFKPDLDNTYVVGDGKYYFGEDYLYIHNESYKGAKWRFQVQGLNDGTTIAKIDCNALGRIFITGNVIDFLIHLKLLESGYPIIHASSVSKNGKAFAFSSRGGGGKTTIALELASTGFSFIGDNYVIIHEGKVLSFPTSLSIFTYNITPMITKNLRFEEKVMLTLKKIVYKGTRGYAKFFTKINPNRILNVIPSSELRTFFLLVPHTNLLYNQVAINEINRNEAINRIIYNQMIEFPPFTRHIEEYSYFFPGSSFSLHWKKYRESLHKNLMENIKFYEIQVPPRYHKITFEKIFEVIRGG